VVLAFKTGENTGSARMTYSDSEGIVRFTRLQLKAARRRDSATVAGEINSVCSAMYTISQRRRLKHFYLRLTRMIHERERDISAESL
jgi:hypothetical protein